MPSSSGHTPLLLSCSPLQFSLVEWIVGEEEQGTSCFLPEREESVLERVGFGVEGDMLVPSSWSC